MNKRLWYAVVLLCSATAQSCVAQEPIRASLRTIAEGGSVPSEEAFSKVLNEDYVNHLSPDSVRDFLPWAQKLLEDPRPGALSAGLQCFLAVTLRRSFDSEVLIGPYVPDLLAIVADRANPFHTMAAYIVTSTLPGISPKTRAYMTAHLADKENTAEDTGWMACALMYGNDPRVIRDVVTFVRKQGNHKVIKHVLTCIRVRPIKPTPEVLALISSGLDSPDEWTRRRSVEAVADLPAGEKPQFLSQLNRLASDAKEVREIRSLAAEALKK